MGRASGLRIGTGLRPSVRRRESAREVVAGILGPEDHGEDQSPDEKADLIAALRETASKLREDERPESTTTRRPTPSEVAEIAELALRHGPTIRLVSPQAAARWKVMEKVEIHERDVSAGSALHVYFGEGMTISEVSEEGRHLVVHRADGRYVMIDLPLAGDEPGVEEQDKLGR